MSTFEQFIENTLELDTEQQLFGVYERALQEFGYDRVVYTLITEHPSIKKGPMHAILGNYPDDWMAYYTQKNFEKIDPVIQVASMSRVPFFWQDIMTGNRWTPEQRRFMLQGDEAGLKDGACVPIFGGPGEVAGVGLASSIGGVDIQKKTLHIIRAITTQFHFRYCELEVAKLGRESKEGEIRLTSRETEILSWCAEGKSDTTIACILSISPDTVKFHKKNIYSKLDVSEQVMAVLKALRLGLINPYYIR